MTDKNKIKQFETELRAQISEVALKLKVGGEAPSPMAILAMLGYQMYIDGWYLNPMRIQDIIAYLKCGYEMAKEDHETDNFLKFSN